MNPFSAVMIPSITRTAIALAFAALSASHGENEKSLFISTPLTAEGQFTAGIEGPASDVAGNIYAVSFEKKETIGKVTPDGKAEAFVTLPGKSAGNGIRFDRDGNM